jgi:hypothetical protein
VARINQDSEAKASFDAQMAAMVNGANILSLFLGEDLPASPDGDRTPFRMLDCDVPGGDPDKIAPIDAALSFVNGQWPLQYQSSHGRNSWYFPANIETTALYPESSSAYSGDDGKMFDVPCFAPKRVEGAIIDTDCPSPFLASITPDHYQSCIQPCPVAAFTDEQYTVMWSFSVAMGVLGFLLNAFVACTWVLGGKRLFKKQPFEIKFCVFAGICIGLLDTLPSLVLKYDLPCACETADCTGAGTICALNRSVQYILLAILTHLCSLTLRLHAALVLNHERAAPKALYVGVPVLLMCAGYALDSDSTSDPNYDLNVARHAFSCRIRFPNMVLEYALLWSFFIASGTLSLYFTLSVWYQTGALLRAASRTDSDRGASRTHVKSQRQRILNIAFLVGVCVLLNTVATLSISLKLESWSMSTDLFLECSTSTWHGLDFSKFGYTESHNQKVCGGGVGCDLSECYWYPGITTVGLTCASSEKNGGDSLEEIAFF